MNNSKIGTGAEGYNNLDQPIELPALPEPTEVEIEVTNHCNARCIACPRHAISAARGFMAETTFGQIIEAYASLQKTLAINRYLGTYEYPLLTLAGLGEPTLHPGLVDFIKAAVKAGLRVFLFSNGACIDEALGEQIILAGVDTIYISFWGIEKEEYESAMGLDYHQVLANVESLARLCRTSNTRMTVGWIKTPVTRSEPQEVLRFWEDRGINADMSEFEPWNRGGYLDDPSFKNKFGTYMPVDRQIPIWCSQLYFTNTITWDGKVVLCSQDYFERKNILGDVFTSPHEIGKAKRAILTAHLTPPLCQECRKPDRNYKFGSQPWDRILNDEQKRVYQYNLKKDFYQ